MPRLFLTVLSPKFRGTILAIRARVSNLVVGRFEENPTRYHRGLHAHESCLGALALQRPSSFCNLHENNHRLPIVGNPLLAGEGEDARSKENSPVVFVVEMDDGDDFNCCRTGYVLLVSLIQNADISISAVCCKY
jgi:hypothetical protein